MAERSNLRNESTVGTWGKRPYSPIYRKRRKSEGIEEQTAALTPKIDELEAAKRTGNVYCKECGFFKKWVDMRASYEKRGTDWFVMWFCKKCGTMCKERNLDDR